MNQNKEFDTLIVSGGGFNGLQFLGIIKYLEEKNLLIKINKFIGVSMGAFINLLVIVGYKFKDIENFITKFDFSKIFDLKFEKIITEDNIKGLTNGENFDKLIKKFLNNKELKENITFKELYEITKKNYIIIVTNITKDKIEIINHENYPNLPIYIGLRMTSCIPIFFEPIEYNNNFYVDGVMKDNFPIQILNDEEISKTLGIVLQLEQSEYDVKNMTTYSYLLHLYRVLTNEPIRNKIKKYKELCKLFIINPKINSFNFQIKNEERIELINYGYELCKSLI
uniref:PNPLA domain-containing protein n=1 Tax=viral metagenome TaxID=1070528 RepID=A0A6C0H0S1_9ZZZZ